MGLCDGFKRYVLAVERALLVLKNRHQLVVADVSSGSAGRKGPCWPQLASQAQSRTMKKVLTV
jgi:hypothetical protein